MHIRILLNGSYSNVFLFRKASTFNGHMPCKEITHLTLPELETSSYTEETPLEKTHDDVYYEKRYEPLQRELVDACTKKLQSRKTGHKDSSRTDCNMLPSDTYDPLRKDHFLKMGHDSSCSDGVLFFSYSKTYTQV